MLSEMSVFPDEFKNASLSWQRKSIKYKILLLSVGLNIVNERRKKSVLCINILIYFIVCFFEGLEMGEKMKGIHTHIENS